MNKELEWFDINVPETVGLYKINIKGEIKSLARNEKRIINGAECTSFRKEKILKPSLSHGYWKIGLQIAQYQRKVYKIHRLLALTFIPNPLNKPCINHINSIKNDNRLENLEWVTYSENTIHAFQNGKIKRDKGAAHYRSIRVKCTITDKIFTSITEASQYAKVDTGYLNKMLHGLKKNHTTLIIHSNTD